MQNITESRNLASQDIDRKSTIEILRIINDEDRKVALAVEREIDAIAMAVDLIVNSFARGGRLVYVGAGTSGRLGVLDASECPPTFGTPEQQVVGLIAGGTVALRQAVEGAEDDPRAGEADLRGIDFCGKDVLVGIAASGRTPYVVGAMKHARTTGAGIVALCCNPGSEIAQLADVAIVPVVGPEVIAGSSRMKAGTAQKLVLNMLSTGAMIKTGKVYGDLMVDVKATNSKLIERQTRIVMQATGCSRAEAVAALDECDRHCKTAIVRVLTGTDCRQARRLLDENGGFIRPALNR